MKLRFVKFLTSRENEIEKREEGGRSPTITCLVIPQLARSQTPLPFSPSSLHHSILSPLSSPTNLPHPPPQLVGRHVPPSSCPSYPSPSCSTSPFLLHKITGAEERGRHCVAWYPACWPSLPTQLWRRPARPQARGPLVLHRFRFLLDLMTVHPHRAKQQENKDRKRTILFLHLH